MTGAACPSRPRAPPGPGSGRSFSRPSARPGSSGPSSSRMGARVANVDRAIGLYRPPLIMRGSPGGIRLMEQPARTSDRVIDVSEAHGASPAADGGAAAVAEEDRRHRCPPIGAARRRRPPRVHLAARQPGAARSVRRRDHRCRRLPARGMARQHGPIPRLGRLAIRARGPDAAHDRRRGLVQAVAAPHPVPDRCGALRCLGRGAVAPRIATAAVRRHDHRQMGGLFGTLAPDGGSRGRDRRHRVHARGAGPTADVLQDRRRRRVDPRGAVAHLPRDRPLHRRVVRHPRRRLDPGRALPRVGTERRLSGAVRRPREVRPPRRVGKARRGDHARDEGAARLRGAEHEARRARGLRRLHALEDADRRRPGRRAVGLREALREEPRAGGPLVQARAHDALRPTRGRDPIRHGPSLRGVRGLHPAAPRREGVLDARSRSTSWRSRPSGST